MIITKDSTVMTSPPSKVTAHRGMDSQKPTSSIFSTISAGRVVSLPPEMPAWVMMVLTMPCTTENRASISSNPWPTAALARMNRINSFSAVSGRRASAKLPQVRTTPTAKNSTRSP